MDLIIAILPVVTKDLPISPRFTPYNFFIYSITTLEVVGFVCSPCPEAGALGRSSEGSEKMMIRVIKNTLHLLETFIWIVGCGLHSRRRPHISVKEDVRLFLPACFYFWEGGEGLFVCFIFLVFFSWLRVFLVLPCTSQGAQKTRTRTHMTPLSPDHFAHVGTHVWENQCTPISLVATRYKVRMLECTIYHTIK